MSEFEIPPHHEGVEVAFEDEGANNSKVFIIGILGLVVFVLSLVGLNDYFLLAREKTIVEMDLGVPSVPLQEMRDKNTATLQSYKLLDSSKAAYRIPIDRAMRIMAVESFEKQESSK